MDSSKEEELDAIKIKVEFTDPNGGIYLVNLIGRLGGLIRLLAILQGFLYSRKWRFYREELSKYVMWHFVNETTGAMVSIKIPWEIYEDYGSHIVKSIVEEELGVSLA